MSSNNNNNNNNNNNHIKALKLPSPPIVNDQYQRTSLCEISLPTNNNQGTTNSSIWIVRGFFPLGEGQKSGLTWEGLRQRILDRLPEKEKDSSSSGEKDISSSIYLDPSGEYKGPNESDPIQKQESNAEELKEEKENVERIIHSTNNADYIPFPLDTTMTVIPLPPKETTDTSSPELWIHSCIPWDAELETEILKLGQPRYLIAASLQHWLFLPQWSRRFPDAQVYVTTDALGESVMEKLNDHLPEHVKPQTLLEGHQIHPDLDQRLFRGAPMNMNEYVFYHEPSQSLIVDDAFYPGYREWDRPSWFGRLWFKMTKGGYHASNLPIYRTARVGTHGDPDEVVRCVDRIVDDWNFTQIIAAHGTSPFRDLPQDRFRQAWYVVR